MDRHLFVVFTNNQSSQVDFYSGAPPFWRPQTSENTGWAQLRQQNSYQIIMRTTKRLISMPLGNLSSAGQTKIAEI